MTDFADPVELARAEIGAELDTAAPGPHTAKDKELIESLHARARGHGFIDERFWVETAQGLVLPAESEADDLEFLGKMGDIRDFAFGGLMRGFNKFSLRRKAAAWCLVFDESTLAPGLEKIADTHQLHVPVVSVTNIEPL